MIGGARTRIAMAMPLGRPRSVETRPLCSSNSGILSLRLLDLRLGQSEGEGERDRDSEESLAPLFFVPLPFRLGLWLIGEELAELSSKLEEFLG